MLNAAVGVSAGVEALTSAYPELYRDRVWLSLAVLGVITPPGTVVGGFVELVKEPEP